MVSLLLFCLNTSSWFPVYSWVYNNLCHLQKSSIYYFEAHKYPYDWRTKKPTIFRATEQWFASVEGFRQAAMDAIGHVKWIPSQVFLVHLDLVIFSFFSTLQFLPFSLLLFSFVHELCFFRQRTESLQWLLADLIGVYRGKGRGVFQFQSFIMCKQRNLWWMKRLLIISSVRTI